MAPAEPAAAKTKAQRHLTCPARACPQRLASALNATATALVPMATCGEATPTTYTSNGTARIEPPPPMRPRTKPTIEPENIASMS